MAYEQLDIKVNENGSITVKRNIEQIGESAQKAQGSVGLLTKALGGLGAALAIKKFIDFSSTWTDIEARVKNATKTLGESEYVMGRLRETANRTYSSFENTAEIYLRNSTALKELGYSTKDVVDFTEVMNNALVVSGAKGERAESVMNALSKAMIKGSLDGQNFQTVLQQGGRITEALAKSLGTTTSGLSQMTREGKITGKALFDAMMGSFDQIREEADNMPATIKDMFVRIKDAVGFAIQDLNKRFQLSDRFVEGLKVIEAKMPQIIALVVAFGAAYIAATAPGYIIALGKAFIGFFAILNANPFVALASAIIGVITYMTLAGDTTKAGIDDITMLSDVYASFAEGAKNVWSDIVGLWDKANGNVDEHGNRVEKTGQVVVKETAQWTKHFDNFFEAQETGFAYVLIIVARTFDSIAGILMGLYEAAKVVFTNIGTALEVIGKGYVNQWIGFVEDIVNFFIKGYNMIQRLTGKAAVQTIQFARLELSKEAESFGEQLDKAMMKGIENQGGALENLLRERFKRAQELAAGRTMGPPAPEEDFGKRTKGAQQLTEADKKRADAIAKVNRALNEEIKMLGMLKPEREAYAKYSEIENQLMQAGIDLNAKQNKALRESIVARIDIIQQNKDIVSEMDRIMEDAGRANKTYGDTIEAAARLLDRAAISQQTYNQEIRKAEAAYRQATNPMGVLLDQLDQEIKLLRMSSEQRQIEGYIIQFVNQKMAEGIEFSKEEIQQLREKLKLHMDISRVASVQDEIFRNSAFARNREFNDQLEALRKIKAEMEAGPSQYDEQDAFSVIQKMFPPEILQGTQMMTDSIYQYYEEMYAKIDQLRQQNAISEQQAIQMTANVAIMQRQQAVSQITNILGTIENLTKSKSKTLFKIGKAAAIANATINAYEAATKAMAQGGFYGAIMAAATLAAAMVQVANIASQQPPGYKAGGFTGNLPIDQMAGVVHGQEFVMNARATKANRGTLEAMNRGEKVGSGVNVVIQNYAPGVRHEVEQTGENEMRIIAREEARGILRSEGDQVMSHNIAQSTSKTSRALGQYTTTTRNFK
jgi:tape measure domain-containing protein